MLKDYFKIFYNKNELLFICAVVSNIITMCISVSFAYLLQLLLDAAAGNNEKELIPILILSAIFFVVFFAAQMVSRATKCEFIKRAVIQYKSKAFESITQKNISSFANENTSSYISVLTNDLTQIEENYLNGIFKIVTLSVSLLGALALMLWYSWLMTLAVIILSIIPIAVSAMFGGKFVGLERSVSDKNEQFIGTVKDMLNGFTVIKSFQSEKQALKLFGKKNKELEDLKYKRRKTDLLVGIISLEASFLMQIGIFIFGAYLSIRGMITVGIVIAFVQLMNNLLDPIQYLPSLLAKRKAAKALIDKFASYASNNKTEDRAELIEDIGSKITLQNVTFSYEDGKDILKGVNFEFQRGKSYAVVGNSGSGKSTLLNILLGGYDNYKGSVMIGAKELNTINNKCLYNILSVIQQNVFIFDSSIKDNITMFKEFDQEIIANSVYRSGLEKLIYEKGYDYQCGENGINLSGGERQRISIARCLLKNTSVLLMDEATASLDSANANNIMNAILDIDGITRIIVTHDLDEDLLKRFDEIIVLKNGVISEQGTFDELLLKKQSFYSLYYISKNA